MLMLLGPVGTQELILIFVLAILIFGPSKIPELARSLGKAFREFKSSTSGIMDSINDEIQKPVAPTQRSAPAPQPLPAASPTAAAPPAAAPTEDDDEEEMVINLEDKEGKKD